MYIYIYTHTYITSCILVARPTSLPGSLLPGTSRNALCGGPPDLGELYVTLSHITSYHTAERLNGASAGPRPASPWQDRSATGLCLSCQGHSIPYHTIPYRTIPNRSVPYRTVPYRTIPHHTIPYQSIAAYYVTFHRSFPSCAAS